MKSYFYKKISNALLGGVLLLSTIGCSDFLDEVDSSNLTPDNFYTTNTHAEAAIAATYDRARFMGNGAGIFSSNWQLLEAPTGTSTTETAQNSDLNNLYSLSYDANTGHIRNWWQQIYQVVANANLVIANVPEINMDEVAKTRIIGEAKFLRAWVYFHAVRLWGDVPLITLPQDAASEDFFPVRTPQETVYAQIVTDLEDAEKAGLSWMDESGRISQAAAKSLLAKVYLTMAGSPLNKGASHYTLAANKAKEVIDNPQGINLFSTYADVHNESKGNTVEHIFSIQYFSEIAGNPMGNMYPNFKPVTYRGNSGTGSTVPDASFYSSYEAGDLRAVDQQGYFYTSYYQNGNGVPFDISNGKPYIFKHFNVTANGTSGVSGTTKDNLNVPVIRFAEVLLIHAEADNEVNGPQAQSYDGLKRIRDRAQLTTANIGTVDQASFREAVWKERWHELCYEQKTWYDMIRLKKVYNHTSDGFDDFVGHLNSEKFTLAEKHLLFPVPSDELINNPNLVDQNTGY